MLQLVQEELVGLEDLLKTWTNNCPPKQVKASIDEHPDFLQKFNAFNVIKCFVDTECRRIPIPTEECRNVNLFVADMR